MSGLETRAKTLLASLWYSNSATAEPVQPKESIQTTVVHRVDNRGISHNVDRTGPGRAVGPATSDISTDLVVWFWYLKTALKILANNFSTSLSLTPCIYSVLPKVRNRRITRQVQEYSLMYSTPTAVSSALSAQGTTAVPQKLECVYAPSQGSWMDPRWNERKMHFITIASAVRNLAALV